MLGGTEFSTIAVGPIRPVSNVRPDRERESAAPDQTRESKTPAEALERRASDPVATSEASEETRDDSVRDREPPVPPRVTFRELGTDDEGGPLVSVEGLPEAVYARPRFESAEYPVQPDLSVYEVAADRAAPGERLDRLA